MTEVEESEEENNNPIDCISCWNMSIEFVYL